MAETLRKWVSQVERDQWLCNGLTTSGREHLKVLERENWKLKRTIEIPAQGLCLFCSEGAQPLTHLMVSFINDHRGEHGVEPVCMQWSVVQ